MPYQHTIEQVQSMLDQAFSALDAWFDADAELRTFRPDATTWSIDEILEHVSITSHYLLIIIRKGVRKALNKAQHTPIAEGESDLARVEVIGHPDAFNWMRPEYMEPTGHIAPATIRATLQQQYHECTDLLKQLAHGEGSLYSVRMTVQDLGKIDMYQWLYFLAQHAYRHQREMQRIEIGVRG